MEGLSCPGRGANPKTGIKTQEDFVAFARKSGKVNFGTYSAGSAPHMTINELNKQYGLNVEPVHYRGEAPLWTGILEGTLDAAMGSYTPHRQSCKATAAPSSPCIPRRSTRSRR